jgi:hypothetical protein
MVEGADAIDAELTRHKRGPYGVLDYASAETYYYSYLHAAF